MLQQIINYAENAWAMLQRLYIFIAEPINKSFWDMTGADPTIVSGIAGSFHTDPVIGWIWDNVLSFTPASALLTGEALIVILVIGIIKWFIDMIR